MNEVVRSDADADADADSEVLSEYEDEIKEYDETMIKYLSTKLCFYNSQDKQITVMNVQKFKIQIRNDDWYQIGRYLIIAKNSKCLKFNQVKIIKDDDTVNEIKQIIEKDKDIGSFIAIETKYNIQTSHPSK